MFDLWLDLPRWVRDLEAGRITRAYALLYGRPPEEDEVRIGREFLARQAGGASAWEQYAHLLICGNEFLFVD